MTREANPRTAAPATAGTPPLSAPAQPVAELTDREKTFTIVGVMLALLLAALDQTIVATAGPAMQRDLRIEQSLYTWITTAYLVTGTVSVPIWGKLSDLYGRKPILLVSITIFLAASVLCGLSGTSTQLIVFRALQGLGSGALFTTAFSVIADIFPPAVRGRYTGLFGAVFGLSSVVGPLAGGFLTDNLSWHWVFFVNIPVGAIALAFIVSRMPLLKRTGQERPTIDWAGAFWLVVTVVPLLLALSLGKTTVTPGETGFVWGSWQIVSMFALAAVGVVAFVFTERRAKDPVINLKLFQNPVFATGIAATFVLGAGFLAAIVFLPLFMVNVVGLSATNSGLTTTPLVLALVAGNIVTGQIVSRVGRYKPLMLIGLSILIVGFAIMGFTLTPSSTQGEVTLKMILLGIGLGPTIPLYTLAVQNAVQPFQIGVTTASLTFFRQMGSTIGIAVLGSIFANTLSSEIASKVSAVTNALPAQLREQFVGGGAAGAGAEGTSGGFNLQAVEDGFKKGIQSQRALYTRAVRDNDPVAVKAVLANKNTPEQLRTALQAGGVAASVKAGFSALYAGIERAVNSGDPRALAAVAANPQVPAALKARLAAIPPQALASPQGRAQVLAGIHQGLDGAETTAVQSATSRALAGLNTGLDTAQTTALQTLPKISQAFKEAFTDGIRNLYRIGIGIIALALLISLLIPELPLRKSNGPAMAPAE